MYRMEKFNAEKHGIDFKQFTLDTLPDTKLSEKEVSSLLNYVEKFQDNPIIMTLLLYKDVEMIGVLSAIITPSFKDYPDVVSSELHFYIKRRYRGTKAFIMLYTAWDIWAKKNGVTKLIMNKSVEFTQSLANKLGFTKEVSLLVREI